MKTTDYIALALLLIGLLLIASIAMKSPFISLRSIKRAFYKLINVTPRQRKKTFSDYAALKLEKKRQNIITSNMKYVEDNVSGGRLKKVKRRCFWCGFALFVIALLMRNYILAPVLYACGRLIPLWLFKATSYKNRKYLIAELEATLNGVTASYIRTEDIVSSVESNLEYMSEPIKSDFTRFVYEVRCLNPSVDDALINLSATNDNEIFQEWVRTLRRCIANTQLKYGLYPIISKFSDVKDIQGEVDTLMRQPFTDFLVLAFIGGIVPPAMSVLIPTMFGAMTTTVFGKILIAAMVLAIMFGVDKAIELLEPISLKGGGRK